MLCGLVSQIFIWRFEDRPVHLRLRNIASIRESWFNTKSSTSERDFEEIKQNYERSILVNSKGWHGWQEICPENGENEDGDTKRWHQHVYNHNGVSVARAFNKFTVLLTNIWESFFGVNGEA